MNLFVDYRQHFILAFDRQEFCHLEEFFHLVYLLYFLDQNMLGNLRELCHVLPLVNQVIGFFVNKKSSSVEVRLCYEEQGLFEVKSFVKDLLG